MYKDVRWYSSLKDQISEKFLYLMIVYFKKKKSLNIKVYVMVNVLPIQLPKKNTIAHSTWNQREFRIDILISPIKYVLTNAIFFLLKLKYIRITIFYQYHAQNNTSNNIPLGVFIKLFSFLLFIWWLIRLKHIQLYFFLYVETMHTF